MTRRVLLIAVVSLVWASGSEASEPAHPPAKPAAPAAAPAAKPQAAKAEASAHVTEVAEPVVPVKSAKRGKTPARGISTESLEDLVARVKARLAEQQSLSTRRPAGAARPRTEDPSKLHLEWRPGVTWPTDLLPPVADATPAPESDGRVKMDWGQPAAVDDGRVKVDWP